MILYSVWSKCKCVCICVSVKLLLTRNKIYNIYTTTRTESSGPMGSSRRPECNILGHLRGMRRTHMAWNAMWSTHRFPSLYIFFKWCSTLEWVLYLTLRKDKRDIIFHKWSWSGLILTSLPFRIRYRQIHFLLSRFKSHYAIPILRPIPF